jgi:hypothetical protein
MQFNQALGISEQIIGAGLLSFILFDVFVTVLYARMDSGILSPRVARVTWRLFRGISFLLKDKQSLILSFCGPAILVVVVLVWVLGLTIGTALIFHSHLGTAIKASNGPTDTDFVTAIFAAGGSLTIVGSGSFAPHTTAFRWFYLFNSLTGLSVLSLTLTYLMQVYSALHRRNDLGFAFYLCSGQRSDAAEILASVGPRGRFDVGYVELANLEGELTSTKEAHHFYPVLFYFRFKEYFYGVSAFCFLALDTVTLIQSALDETQYGWLQESSAVSGLRDASEILLRSLERTFLNSREECTKEPDAATRERWRKRFLAGIARLKRAGITKLANLDSGAERYITLRTEWDCYVRRLVPAGLYSLSEIDPNTTHASSSGIAA